MAQGGKNLMQAISIASLRMPDALQLDKLLNQTVERRLLQGYPIVIFTCSTSFGRECKTVGSKLSSARTIATLPVSLHNPFSFSQVCTNLA